MSKKQNATLPTAKVLKDEMDVLQQVWDARQAGATFTQLEEQFNLRRANGMTSYRLVQRYKAMSKSEIEAFAFVDEAPERLIGAKAYDSDALAHRLSEQRNIELIAPNRSNRKVRTQDGRSLRRYRRRWKSNAYSPGYNNSAAPPHAPNITRPTSSAWYNSPASSFSSGHF